MQDLSIRYNLWRLNLKWTKLKKLVMEKTAPEVLKRIDFQIARYRTNKKEEGRCFILLDKQEVFSACTFTKRREKAKLLSSYSEEEADKILKKEKSSPNTNSMMHLKSISPFQLMMQLTQTIL